MTKKYSTDFENALQQRAERAQQIVLADVSVITQAELIVAGIEQGTVNGVAADTFLIAANQHVPQGNTTVVGAEDDIASKADFRGVRQPHVGGAEFGASRKTPQDRADIVELQGLKTPTISLDL